MKTLESTSTISGEDRIVKFGMRTGVELIEKISGEKLPEVSAAVVKALDRVCTTAQWNWNRHDFLPDLRLAGKVVEGEFTAKTEAGQKKEQEWAVALLERLENGEVFDLLDFAPEGGGARIPAELKPFWEQAKVMHKAAGADPAKVERAKMKFGEFSVEAIAKALKAIADKQPDLF